MKIETKEMILVAMFAALTALGAFIRIPIPYVPFTLQFLFCALSGAILGARLGAISQFLYVIIGLIGIPIFTEGGGPSYIFKPTFGYLIGFIAASYVIGKLIEKMKYINIAKAFFSILSGLFFVYLFGVTYLYIIYNLYLGSTKTFVWAIFYGFTVCVLGDLLLSFITALAIVKIINLLKKKQLIIKLEGDELIK